MIQIHEENRPNSHVAMTSGFKKNMKEMFFTFHKMEF